MTLYHGDCLEELKKLDADSIDALVTDPPYGWNFMGKEWDRVESQDDRTENQAFQEWTRQWALEVFRVLKPGAHALIFCGPRTYHRMASGVEDAGFEVRDQLQWIFGSGFPKSLDVSKAIDKAAGAEREALGRDPNQAGRKKNTGIVAGQGRYDSTEERVAYITNPATDAAKQWQGWGTALKPANEPILLARKPLSEKTVSANVLKWGTGALNIDGTRIGTQDMSAQWDRTWNSNKGELGKRYSQDSRVSGKSVPPGRFPANLILDEVAGAMLDAQSIAAGVHLSGKGRAAGSAKQTANGGVTNYVLKQNPNNGMRYQDGTHPGASRFFYCAKVSASERNAGLDCYEIINVSVGAWDNADQKAVLRVDTDKSVPRVIDASGTLKKSVYEWNTLLFGNVPMVESRKGFKSTTKTERNSTTESRILNWLLRFNTSASIRDAKSEKASGGSRAPRVSNLKESMNITNAPTDIVISVRDAPSKDRLQIKSAGNFKSSHPTVKPQRLMRYLCRLITPPNGLVLDPFMGSGSTGLAAKSEGFRFVGIEREEEYYDIARARIDNSNPQWELSGT